LTAVQGASRAEFLTDHPRFAVEPSKHISEARNWSRSADGLAREKISEVHSQHLAFYGKAPNHTGERGAIDGVGT
tara:strand:+ start:373 stop:597 length:225 start_codon:yes stop_codon:yes gene_type:complete